MGDRLGYVPALDGLRAVAITAVLVSHAFAWPSGGWLGVDVFFVLSGFLITALLLNEHRANGKVSLRRFYARRARRLFPALFAMLAVVLIVERDLAWVAVGAGYTMNFAMANDAGWPIPPLAHLWSLAAEEQFYLLWPLVLFVVLAGRVKRGLAIAAGAAVVTTLWAYALHLGQAPWERIAFAPDTRGMTILVGCALALYVAERPLRLRWLELPAVLALGVFMLFGKGSIMLTGLPLLILGLVCAVLIVRALDAASPLARVLSIAPVVFVGQISYALYLWHMPINYWVSGKGEAFDVRHISALAITFAAAVLSYYLVERPFRLMSRRSEPTLSRPSTAEVAPTPLLQSRWAPL